MTLEYIEDPNIRTHKIKAMVKEIMLSAETDRWIIIYTTETKEEKELSKARNKSTNYRNVYSMYPLQWAVHEGENNYSLIVKKLETKTWRKNDNN
jgi:hypothetical protein